MTGTAPPPPMTQAEADQIAGAFWAAAMCTDAMLVGMLGLVLPSPPWGSLILGGLLAAPANMALISFVMPVRSRWGAALRSIRLRGR
jgi:hypothetical protein